MVEEHTKNKANQSKESKEAMLFLKQKMDAAQGFIDAVKQRQNTLLTTMQAIIDLQRPFFEEGDESLLRPMILKDVAERAKLDISTISRVSNSKYVQTNYGIYPLKFFFSDGYTKEDGEEMSVREIKKALKECVDSEDKKNPYTDDELTDRQRLSDSPPHRSQISSAAEHPRSSSAEIDITKKDGSKTHRRKDSYPGSPHGIGRIHAVLHTFPGFPDTVPVLIPEHHAHSVQTHCAGHCLLLHHHDSRTGSAC